MSTNMTPIEIKLKIKKLRKEYQALDESEKFDDERKILEIRGKCLKLALEGYEKK